MTADGKFEVGDTVICIKHPDPQAYPIAIGTVFTVRGIGISGHLRRIDDTHGECFNPWLFELHRPFGTHRLLKRGGL